MEYGISILGIVPLRAEAKDQSEIISQILFGQHFKIIETQPKWIKIELASDKYVGWICAKQYVEITHEDYDNLSLNDFPLAEDVFTSLINTDTNEPVPISMGAVLPYYHKGMVKIRNKKYKYIRNFYNDLPNTPPADVVRSVSYREMIRLRNEGKLNKAQKSTFIQPRAKEEFYDIRNDPFELKNLALSSDHVKQLKKFRQALAKWQKDTQDKTPPFRTLDEFGREDGQALPVRERPRPNKTEMTKRLRAYYEKKQAK